MGSRGWQSPGRWHTEDALNLWFAATENINGEMVNQLEAGQTDTDLGGGVYKKEKQYSSSVVLMVYFGNI